MSDSSNVIRLLLVDDEVDFLDAASRALARRGFEVSKAPDAVAALEILEHQLIEVAVLDVKMPGMDGVQLFKQIQTRWPMIAVIMLTGHATIQQAFTTSRDGVFDYLPKPFDFDDLAALCRRAADHRREKASSVPTAEHETVKVLIVDDEPEFLATMKKVLSRRDMEVTTASSGDEALEAIGQSPPFVVVLDLRMPGMHGLDVLHSIKESYPDIEVILLTGHPRVSLAYQGMKEGAFDFIVKPQDVDLLAEKIRAAARARRERLERRSKSVVERLLRGRAD